MRSDDNALVCIERSTWYLHQYWLIVVDGYLDLSEVGSNISPCTRDAPSRISHPS